eukprot:5465503-Amphidinium_carterae.1
MSDRHTRGATSSRQRLQLIAKGCFNRRSGLHSRKIPSQPAQVPVIVGTLDGKEIWFPKIQLITHSMEDAT